MNGSNPWISKQWIVSWERTDREINKKKHMSRFITVTLVKDSEEGLEKDTPILLNSHYIMKVADSDEDEYGQSSIALASGEFLFVQETRDLIMQMLA